MGSLTPLQRCSQCILQPQLIGQEESVKYILIYISLRTQDAQFTEKFMGLITIFFLKEDGKKEREHSRNEKKFDF